MPIRSIRVALVALLAGTLAGCGPGNYGGPYNRPYGRPGYSGYEDPSVRTITCESEDGRGHSCRAKMRIGHAEIDKRLSDAPCQLGRTWGFDKDEVWVDRGCRARFRLYPQDVQGDGWGGGSGYGYGGDNSSSSVIRCESEDNRRRRCEAGFRIGRAMVERQLSNTRCDQGRTWGSDGRGVWVDRGCRAEFRVYRR